MEKLKFIIISTFLLIFLTSCNSTKDHPTVETTKQVVETTQIVEEPTILTTTVGGTISLESDRTYIFGVDIAPGTYQLEVETLDGAEITTTFIFNQDCQAYATSKSYGHTATYKMFDPIIWENGFKIKLTGDFEVSKLHLMSTQDTGFDFNSGFCSL